MDDFLTVVKTTKKVQSNINKFESLSLKESTSSANSSSKPRKTIAVLDENGEEQHSPTEDLTLSTKDDRSVVSDAAFVEVNQTTSEPILQESKSDSKHAKHDSAVFVQKAYLSQPAPASLPDDALQVLKSQPGIEDVKAVLQYLQYGIDGRHDFDIRVTGPKSSMLFRVLVTTTVPDIWDSLIDKISLSHDEKQMRDTLEHCFFSLAGIEALLTQARELTRLTFTDRSHAVLHNILDLLQNIVSDPKTLLRFLEQGTVIYQKEIQRKLFWQTLVSLISGSKILSTVSQIAATVQGFELHEEERWLASAEIYSRWLAKNVVHAAMKLALTDDQSWACLALLLKRGLTLGHKGKSSNLTSVGGMTHYVLDVLIRELYTSLLLGSRALWTPLSRLLKGLPSYDQKIVFDGILRDTSSTFFGTMNQEALYDGTDPSAAKAVSGVAALISGLVSNNELLMDHVVELIAAPGNTQASAGIGAKRALIVFLSQYQSRSYCFGGIASAYHVI